MAPTKHKVYWIGIIGVIGLSLGDLSWLAYVFLRYTVVPNCSVIRNVLKMQSYFNTKLFL